MKLNDITIGSRSHYLTVIADAGTDSRGRRKWTCVCKCGNTKIARFDHLLSGGIKSCGCLRVEAVRATGKANKGRRVNKNQKTIFPEKKIWKNMIARCCNPNDISYKYYGEKGVTVCPEWMLSFDAFYKHVGPRPSPSHSIDRYPNKSGNYEPGNVRWATAKEQQRNLTNNRLITINNQTLCIAEWAEISGIPDGVIRHRIRANWPDCELLKSYTPRKKESR